MHIEKYEKYYMVSMFVFLCAAAVALIVSVVGQHASLPEPAGRIDPADIDADTELGPFSEPGLHDNGDGTYDLVMIGQAWAWTPAEVSVPADTDITIKAVSRDVTHGIRIPDTNVNVMVIPGQVSEVEVNFSEPGRYSVICHEYCGLQHHTMGGVIVVED